MKRLDLVVGPNGGGKSTVVELTLAPLLPGSVFVNADEAARIAAETRSRLIQLGRPFIAETVFSHPSKLELIRDAHAANYIVVLHVLLITEELAVQRVKYRVRAGGHDVPEIKIRERYRRLWTLVTDAIAQSDTATIYDNTDIDGPQIVAQMSGGGIVGSPSWPAWTPEALRSRWPD